MNGLTWQVWSKAVGLKGDRTYVGFGLGAIQAGLFLYEALQSGSFRRLVVAEILPEIVHCVRENRGFITVNIARADRVEAVPVGPVDILNPAVGIDRQKLVDTLAVSDEIGTAVPAIRFYSSEGPESLCRILAAGLRGKAQRGGPRAVLYAAENHNHAAEILEELVLEVIPLTEREVASSHVRFLNTVIGKMSGTIIGRREIAKLGLDPMTPDSDRAFLVEAFNQILVSRISFPNEDRVPAFERGITTFIEKENLLPFEEAKLFGHNATHALAAYLGEVLSIRRIADIPSVPGFLEFLRRAFIEESGRALIHRYHGIDPLFTSQGYEDYAEDLLKRMVNPWLTDTSERVGRDVSRKLGWEDRLVGTLRLGIAEGVTPHRYALGAAAALIRLDPSLIASAADPSDRLLPLWGAGLRDPAQEIAVLALIRDAISHLRRWYSAPRGEPRALLGEL
jgi:mannitol-1-phosphate/altronate dehydrogenase